MMQDLMADVLTRLRNAKKGEIISIPRTRKSRVLIQILEQKNILLGYKEEPKTTNEEIESTYTSTLSDSTVLSVRKHMYPFLSEKEVTVKRHGRPGAKNEEQLFTQVQLKEEKSYKQMSKPSRRIYVSAKKIPLVLDGHGFAILSTSKGFLTDQEARRLNVGGEYICDVY